MISNTELQNIRAEYSAKSLLEENVLDNPIDQFKQWFKEAVDSDVSEVNAMVLATAVNNKPSARVVLLKTVEDDGFVFFTNYSSDKGEQLAQNPHAAITFFWHELERQVRVEGEVEKIPVAESEAYFNSRPRLSQLGAWASNQSSEVVSREALEHKMKALEKEFEGKEIVKPEHWGGYILKPLSIEFWQGRPGRLHDRILYNQITENSWTTKRLSP